MVPWVDPGIGKVFPSKGFGGSPGLVSHQEEFANAFADGYRFERSEGATRVTRFQR
jgi:hypothetical protein